ncbi:MAG TPA: BON domain-containing protein [Puia sp.]|jgi:osmotically-inducible protein OsmY|nr:BON domain-containing protein [Puia sp.]
MIERSELEGVLKDTLSLSGCRINVKVSKSKITLTGLVKTPEQKLEAERIAWKVVGVWTVGNELNVDAAGEGFNSSSQ